MQSMIASGARRAPALIAISAVLATASADQARANHWHEFHCSGLWHGLVHGSNASDAYFFARIEPGGSSCAKTRKHCSPQNTATGRIGESDESYTDTCSAWSGRDPQGNPIAGLAPECAGRAWLVHASYFSGGHEHFAHSRC